MENQNEEVDVITLIDENGEETLFEIILQIDGQEAFGKQYILLTEAGIDEEEEAQVYAYSYIEDEEGNQGELLPVESDEEWDMIEETFNTLFEE